MYVKYCENKPKSEHIVAEFIDFFEVKNRTLFVLYIVVSCDLFVPSSRIDGNIT